MFSPVTPLAAMATFYFTYFAFQGLFNPFWSLYLASLSFSALDISILMALSTLTRLVGPLFWGWLADRTGQRRRIMFWSSLVAASCFAVVVWQRSFWGIFIPLALCFFFWTAALPLAEASTTHLTRSQPGRYSRIRVWGSIGFVCLSSAGGYLLNRYGMAGLPWMMLAALVAIVAASWLVPEVAAPPRVRAAGSIWQTVRQPRVLALFGCCFLLAFAMGPYYNFYSLGLKQSGYDKSAIGWLWSLGVMAEVVIFWQMPRLMARFSLPQLMLSSLLVSAVRFAMIATLLPYPALAVLAQLGHAFTFGVHHAASVGLIHRWFPASQQARGQGLYTVASFGIGGSAGGLLSGVLWEQGGLLLTFGVSTAAAVLGAVVCLRWLREDEPQG